MLNQKQPLETTLEHFPEGTVFPGQSLSEGLSGPGTRLGNDGYPVATRLGRILRSDRQVSVTSYGDFYEPSANDVVVGRVCGVQPHRWLLDIGAVNPAVLRIDSVDLPGLQRQRDAADEANMRAFLKEGDLMCVELRANGQAHTRNRMFGKLQHGVFMKVSPRRLTGTQHFISLREIVSVILGKNGAIWISGLRTGAQSAVVDAAPQELSPEASKLLFEVYNFIQTETSLGREITTTSLKQEFDTQ